MGHAKQEDNKNFNRALNAQNMIIKGCKALAHPKNRRVPRKNAVKSIKTANELRASWLKQRAQRLLDPEEESEATQAAAPI